MSKILVVEDDRVTRLFLKRDLEIEGYDVTVAKNGAEGLQLAEKLQPGVIICDWVMPFVNGMEVCRQVKANDDLNSAFFILLTSQESVKHRVKGLDAGADEFLAKPVDPNELLARVRVGLRQYELVQQLKQTNEQLTHEREKADRLLQRILPKTIAEQLKEYQGSLAERFQEATVLFADIVGFTPFSAQISPLELVNVLNKIFSQFDQLAEKHGLEKIKTIGDAYMVAGGLPIPRPDHACAIAAMALDMQEAIAKIPNHKQENFTIRIGIHSGPVVAGVIGVTKFIYDLWGDTVNVASRMESSGVSSKIQVTEKIYNLCRDRYLFEKRGEIEVKGKGKMTTYWLIGKK